MVGMPSPLQFQGIFHEVSLNAKNPYELGKYGHNHKEFSTSIPIKQMPYIGKNHVERNPMKILQSPTNQVNP